MKTKPFQCQIIREPLGLREVRNSRVLLYWPHGFGDWLYLSMIIEHLDPSNQYFVTRFGDHAVSLFEGCTKATPIYGGSDELNGTDGHDLGIHHFGFERGFLSMPGSIHYVCTEAKIDVFAYFSFFEPYGNFPAPAHTKARSMLHEITGKCPSSPLTTCIDLSAPPSVLAWVEARLRTYCGFEPGKKLCVIARHGTTSVDKNWGHLWGDGRPEGQDARDFIMLSHQDDPSWIFITMEERDFEGEHTISGPLCHSYFRIFNGGPPLGLVLKALYHFTTLCVGVPTGPYHLAHLMPNVAVVGVWLRHWPLWYDEPRAGVIHIVGKHVYNQSLDQRIGSLREYNGVRPTIIDVESLNIPGEAVLEASKQIL